jgi:molybdate transport system ATP-binding protein
VDLDWEPLLLTLKLAAVVTAILAVIGVPLAYLLAFGRFRGKSALEALVTMPLVLPPSVLGFYLLIAFSPRYAFGHWLETVFDIRLAFSFEGLVVASVIFSLPFLVHPVQSGFQSLPPSLTEAAYILGKSRLTTLLRVLLPNIRPALLAGGVISFAHTIGEFGGSAQLPGRPFLRRRAVRLQLRRAADGICHQQEPLEGEMIELRAQQPLHTADGDLLLDVDIRIEAGEFVTLFGPSGAGKTTLLRILAGLLKPAAGRVAAFGDLWFDGEKGIDMPPQQRRVGFVFQDYALFPNMTVRGNLEFALDNKSDRRRVDELLDMTGLVELQHRRPDTLSGGQKQRVALVRALVRRPRLLLLDEPLSALDSETRLRLQDDILQLQRAFGTTTMIVSHDLPEVFKLSSRVLVVEHGRIARDGRPSEVFSDRRVSGKFQFTGIVMDIEPSDTVFAVSVLVGNQIAKVIATRDEIAGLGIGSKVMLLSKAFNPMLIPVR